MAYVSSLALHNAILHREIEKLSITDRLTGLYDHAYFQERLAEEVANAKRYKRKVSLLMLDIDNFKKFNDTFGHPRGDQVLKKIGEVLREVIREGDIAARYGGEEFVVILPETAKAEAVRVAERVRRRIEREKFEGNKEFPLVTQSVSVGVATYPDDALSKGDLIEQADRALYRAKWGGRNKVAVAESISKEAEKDDDEKGEVEESGKREDTSG
jgi:diguanylate cyclase (GGDEF)-like protein